MALTLVEASKYSNDVLQRGVVELLVKDDPILERLKFKDIKGNGLTYDEETTIAGADFYAVNDTWLQKESTVTQRTALTKIIGGDADVDNFLKATRSNVQDLMGEQIKSKVKSIKRTYLDTFYYGDADNDANRFNGLHSLMTSTAYNTVAVATSTATAILLSLTDLEETVDLVKNGDADVMVMTKKMRRSINKYLRGVGGITSADIQGKTVQTLNDIMIVVSDHLSDDESADKSFTNVAGSTVYGHNDADGVALADDDNATSIFVLQFDDQAVSGIQSAPITTERFAKLETKDAARVRIKWYPGLMFQSLISSAKLTGLDPAGAVAA